MNAQMGIPVGQLDVEELEKSDEMDEKIKKTVKFREHTPKLLVREKLSDGSMDEILTSEVCGVEMAFERAKAWSKYCKEIVNYIQQRVILEIEKQKTAKNLSESARKFIKEEKFMPLKDVYMENFEIESFYYQHSNEAFQHMCEENIIKPLEHRRSEHEANLQSLNVHWEHQQRLLHDASVELRGAKRNYVVKAVAYHKACQAHETEINAIGEKDLGRIERRQKIKEDTLTKKDEALLEYNDMESKLKQQYSELEKVKREIIGRVRELIYKSEQTTKQCAIEYCQAFSTLSNTLPLRYEQLTDIAKRYLPGTEYKKYIDTLPEKSYIAKAASIDDIPAAEATKTHKRTKSAMPTSFRHRQRTGTSQSLNYY